MPLTREDAATELGARLGRDWTATGLAVADSSGNLKEPIDDALRDLGVGEDDLADAEIAGAAVRVFLRIAEFYAVEKALATARADWIDNTLDSGGVGEKASQFVAALERRLARAEAAALPLGLGAATAGAAAALASASSTGVMTLDFVEPVAT